MNTEIELEEVNLISNPNTPTTSPTITPTTTTSIPVTTRDEKNSNSYYSSLENEKTQYGTPLLDSQKTAN